MAASYKEIMATSEFLKELNEELQKPTLNLAKIRGIFLGALMSTPQGLFTEDSTLSCFARTQNDTLKDVADLIYNVKGVNKARRVRNRDSAAKRLSVGKFNVFKSAKTMSANLLNIVRKHAFVESDNNLQDDLKFLENYLAKSHVEKLIDDNKVELLAAIWASVVDRRLEAVRATEGLDRNKDAEQIEGILKPAREYENMLRPIIYSLIVNERFTRRAPFMGTWTNYTEDSLDKIAAQMYEILSTDLTEKGQPKYTSEELNTFFRDLTLYNFLEVLPENPNGWNLGCENNDAGFMTIAASAKPEEVDSKSSELNYLVSLYESNNSCLEYLEQKWNEVLKAKGLTTSTLGGGKNILSVIKDVVAKVYDENKDNANSIENCNQIALALTRGIVGSMLELDKNHDSYVTISEYNAETSDKSEKKKIIKKSGEKSGNKGNSKPKQAAGPLVKVAKVVRATKDPSDVEELRHTFSFLDFSKMYQTKQNGQFRTKTNRRTKKVQFIPKSESEILEYLQNPGHDIEQ